MSAQAKRAVVLVTEGCDPRPLAWLRDRVEVIELATSSPDFDAALRTADGLSVRTYTRVDAALLARAPRLRVVGRGGVGLDNIDVAACRARNIEVVYTPDANTIAVGDYVMGAILQLIRPWARFKDRAYAPEEFKKLRASLRGRQLNEMTLGILGFGRVGRRVAGIASRGFGMRILCNDLLTLDPASIDFPAEPVDKPALYRQSDVLSIHVDMRPQNRHLVGREQIGMMKKGSVLINTSRGEVLDAHALADGIRSEHLSAAALDVFDPEPPPADFPLLGLDNVVLTPHMASRTATAIENMGWVVRDIVQVLEGKPPAYPAPR